MHSYTLSIGILRPEVTFYEGQRRELLSLAVSQTVEGPLTGGPQCRMSILRNGHVPCHYFVFNFHVGFKMVTCTMSILRTPYVVSFMFSSCSLAPCRVSILRNGHVAVSNLGVRGHRRVGVEGSSIIVLWLV